MIERLNIYRSLRFYEVIEQLLLVVFAFALPLWWRISLFISFLLLVNLVVKSITTRHIGNHSLGTNGIVIWCAVIFFVAIYAISLFYTDNLKEGFTTVGRHLSFVVMAVYFLASDLSYMRREHVYAILYAMTLALLMRFMFFLIVAIHGYFLVHHNVQLIIGGHFDPLHHSYLSMYILLSLVFLYSILVQVHSWGKIVMFLASMIPLSAYIFFIQARMGFVLLLLFFIGVIIHQVVVYHRYVATLIVVVSFALVTVALFKTAPLMTQRFATISSLLSDSHDDDVRYPIMRANVNVIKQNPVFGVGVGDRMDALTEAYQNLSGGGKILSPHNQYLDTIICTGVLGMVALLLILLIPLIDGIRVRNYLLIALVLIVAISSFTESILERQMGMLFFCFFLGILPRLSTVR